MSAALNDHPGDSVISGDEAPPSQLPQFHYQNSTQNSTQIDDADDGVTSGNYVIPL